MSKPRTIDHFPIFLWSILFTSAVVFMPVFLAAQETDTGRQLSSGLIERMPSISSADVQAALDAFEADAGIEDAVKDRLRSNYKQAIEILNEAANFAAQATKYKETISTAAGQSAAYRRQLEDLASAEETVRVPPTASVEDLQKEILSRRAVLRKLKDDLSSIKNELGRVKERPFEMSSRLPEIQRELSEIRQQPVSPQLSEDAPSPGRIADQILLQARLTRLISESDMLEQEQLSQPLREELLQAQYELYSRQVENAEAGLSALEEILKQQLSDEAAILVLKAKMMAEEVPEADQPVLALADEVQALAKEFETVAKDLEKAKGVTGELVASLEQLAVRYDSVREQLTVSHGGHGMALVLIEIQDHISGLPGYLKGLTSPLPFLDAARLASLSAEEKIRKQPEVEAQFAAHPSETVAALVTTRRDVLDKLRTQYGNLVRDLASLDGVKRQYTDTAKEVQNYISEQLFGFGMRTATPIGFKTFTDLPGDLRWFFQPDHWIALGRVMSGTVERQPVFSTFILFITALLLITRRWMVSALDRTGTQVRRVTTDKYAYTGETLLWTFLLSLPIPLLIGFSAWTLQQESGAGRWVQGIGYGMHLTAWIILGVTLLSEVCRPGGLGSIHFRWPEKQLTRLRRAIRWFAVVYIPAQLITYSSLVDDSPDFILSVGRLSFMLAQIGMMIILGRMLRISDGILTKFIQENPNHFTSRGKYVWFALILALPATLAILAGMGYMFTALRLSTLLLETAALIAGGVILYWLTRRWFRFKLRQLALAETLEKQRLRREAAGGQHQSADLISVDSEDEEKLNLLSISEQTNYLLRSIYILGVAVSVFFLWSGTFKVFATFGSIPIPLIEGLNLLALFQATLILVIIFILVRNLPGFMELAVLRATTIDPGTRNAISTLTQYAVVAIGLSLLFNILQVDWAKFGWIAAALSVGIGFGLQEVVANFVCGLILLFERPIGVGDVVSIDGMTGTVTKIRIRATTITNADRQDFVVPNKRLITGSLLNWTLTTKLNRVVIAIGVDSASDPDRARQLLIEIAKDHPEILDDPPPTAAFEQFGDSALNIVLYAFLPDLENRANTISEVHSEIKKRFTAAGIEIPNPQFDLHIRNKTESNATGEVLA